MEFDRRKQIVLIKFNFYHVIHGYIRKMVKKEYF
jgi:hypothetical protein